MEEKSFNIYNLASQIEDNNQKEAEAITFYTRLLADLSLFKEGEGIDQEMVEDIAEQIEEIVADELNHMEKLRKIYHQLTDIKANKD